MKYIITIPALIVSVCCILSCKVSCLTPQLVQFNFSNNNDSIPDTSANFVAYNKDNHFSTIVNSYTNIPITRTPYGGNYLIFPVMDNNIYDHDWMITLFPSGKVYKVSYFSHSNNSQSTGLNGVHDNCVNSVKCNVNGATYSAEAGRSTNGIADPAWIVVNY